MAPFGLQEGNLKGPQYLHGRECRNSVIHGLGLYGFL